jgi:DNA invertase Pin-like site-specific DNA recombinase
MHTSRGERPDQRSAYASMLKDVVRRRFYVPMVWSIDRLGRSILHAANALVELDAGRHWPLY